LILVIAHRQEIGILLFQKNSEIKILNTSEIGGCTTWTHV
jgi:hypothetical protein